jgi:hypothetical protein
MLQVLAPDRIMKEKDVSIIVTSPILFENMIVFGAWLVYQFVLPRQSR